MIITIIVTKIVTVIVKMVITTIVRAVGWLDFTTTYQLGGGQNSQP